MQNNKNERYKPDRKMKRKKYKLTVASATENLEVVRDFIRRLATRADFSVEQSEQIELAVDEACTNVIKHAYKFNPRRLMHVIVFVDDEKMEIQVEDKGPGFDFEKLEPPQIAKRISGAKPGGLGIHIMKKVMDKVEFSINPGKRNRVTLIKYRNRQNVS